MNDPARLDIAVVARDPDRADLVRCLEAASPRSRVGSATPRQLAPGVRLVVTEMGVCDLVLESLVRVGSDARVVVVGTDMASTQLTPLLEHDRVAAVLLRGEAATWDPAYLTYVARRSLIPEEAAPTGSMLLPWGATTAMWRAASSGDLRHVLDSIDEIGRRAGLSRRELADVAWVGHELMMNAIYDAPTDASGRFLHAADRSVDVQLPPEQSATVRLAIAATGIAIDVRDPFGSLERGRFLGGILVGTRHQEGEGPALDTSHGGAGLGIHGCYSRASLLRAEVEPQQSTLVSWLRSRDPTTRTAPSWVYVSRPAEAT